MWVLCRSQHPGTAAHDWNGEINIDHSSLTTSITPETKDNGQFIFSCFSHFPIFISRRTYLMVPINWRLQITRCSPFPLHWIL